MRLVMFSGVLGASAALACAPMTQPWEVDFERAEPGEQLVQLQLAHERGQHERVVALAPKFRSPEFLPTRLVNELEALSMLKLGQFSQAVHRLQLLLAQSPDSRLEAKLAEARLRWAVQVGTADVEAATLLQRRLKEGTLDVDGQVALAREAARTGQKAEWGARCEDLLRREPANLEVFRVCRGAESKVTYPRPPPRLKPCG